MLEPIRYGTRGLALCAVVLAGCGEPLPVDEIEAPASAQEALSIAVTREAVAYDVARRDQMPHGVAGDERLIFTAEPLNGRVVVLDRYTGRQVAELPPPPSGWRLPFSLHLTAEGNLVVLDPGGFPAPGVLVEPMLHEYAYTMVGRRFEATLVRTISLGAYPIVFPEDFEITEEGFWVISEAGIGALWIVFEDGTIAPGIFPASFSPFDAVPALSGCAWPDGVVVDGIPVTVAGGFAPGVGSLESRDGQLYFGNTCTGGLWSVPLESLVDGRAPHERAADIVRVTERPEGVLAEPLKGLNFRDGDPDLYALDSLRLRVIRIDVETGEREVVLEDDQLLDFPVSATFLPPVLGLSPFIVVSDQEHRLAALNTSLTEDVLEIPFLVTKMYIRR